MKQNQCKLVFGAESWRRHSIYQPLPLHNMIRQIVMLIVVILVPISANASVTCKGHFVNPITDVCWGCLLPISIGGFEIGNKHPQHTSVMGLTKCPLQVTLALADIGKIIAIISMTICLIIFCRRKGWYMECLRQDSAPNTSISWFCFIFLSHPHLANSLLT